MATAVSRSAGYAASNASLMCCNKYEQGIGRLQYPNDVKTSESREWFPATADAPRSFTALSIDLTQGQYSIQFVVPPPPLFRRPRAVTSVSPPTPFPEVASCDTPHPLSLSPFPFPSLLPAPPFVRPLHSHPIW